MSLKHAFQSTATDGADATKLRPSNWNAAHTFDGGALGSLLMRDTGASDGASWIADVAAGSVLVSGGVGVAPAWSATPSLSGLTVAPGHATWTENDTARAPSGSYGPTFNKLSTVNNAHSIAWAIDGTVKWEVGQDFQNADFVPAYDATLPGDVFRVSPASANVAGVGALFEMASAGAGSPAANDSALYIRPGTGKNALKLFVTGNLSHLVFAQNSAGTKRTKITWGGSYQMGTDADQNNTNDFWIWDGSAFRFKITPTTTVIGGSLTTDGGLQTFGANDSAGAGFRLVRVPNV